MRVAVGADHGGFRLKEELVQLLKEEGHDVDDVGTHSEDSVDYPDFAEAVSRLVSEGAAEVGLLVCGTGIGQSIVANKVAGVRAAVIHDVTTAHLAREHNDANVICLGARITGAEVAKEALQVFLSTSFDADGRHGRRVGKINALDGRTANQETS